MSRLCLSSRSLGSLLLTRNFLGLTYVTSIRENAFQDSLLRRYATSRSKRGPLNPYDALGVSRDVKASELKKTYFELVKKYHPDTNKDPDAQARFIEIQQAYEILSDPQKKATYDATGSTEAAEGNYEPQSEAPHFDPADIFRTMFGSNSATRGSSPFAEFFGGETDINIPLHLPISFIDAALGTSKQVTYSCLEPCSPCNGSGVAGGGKLRICTSCRGTGQETRTRGPVMFSTTCRSCRGAGASNPNPCQTCTGEGVVKGQRTSDIKIPAGVDTDQILSLRGMGNVVGGRRGDLRLRISVTPSTIFRREGDDVHTTVDVPLLSALVGGTTRIATIHGDVEIRVLSGTQPGDVKRLISKGIHNETSGNIGSHYVTLKIVLPKSLTERQRDLLVALFGDETKTPGSQSEPSKQQGASSVGNKWSAWISEKIFGK